MRSKDYRAMHLGAYTKMKKDNQKIERLLYSGIFLLALFLRIYRLSELPYGIHVDEAGMGYDAYSIAHWGLDRYCKFYPVYFINYGGGQSVLYGYLCALLMKIFEPSVLIFRIPAVCSGMLTCCFGAWIIRKALGRKAGMIGAFLLAVCPCFILTSRLGLDCYLFLGTSTVALYFFIHAVEAGKDKKMWYAVSGLGFGISLYSYALSWLVIPLFLLCALTYLIYIRKICWKQILVIGIPLMILAMPLMLMLCINFFELPEIATTYITIPRLMEFRASEISFKHVINNIPVLIQTYFFNDEWLYNSIPTYFSLYVISIPFALVGIRRGLVLTLEVIRDRKFSISAMIFLWFCAQTCMGLVIKGPCVNKMNGIFFSLLFFTVYGIRECWLMIQKENIRKWFVIGTAVTYMAFFAGFIKYYFTEYIQDTFPLPYFDALYADVLETQGGGNRKQRCVC